MRARVAAFVSVLILLPGSAWAGGVEQPNTMNERFIMPRLHLGGGFSPQATVLRWGPGVGMFFGKGLGLSVEVDHTAVLFSKSFTEDYPGIGDAVPSHLVRATAAFEWIMMPLEDFSPYLRAGLGPMIQSGTQASGPRRVVGSWEAGLGIIFYVDGFFIDVGAMVTTRFPDRSHRDAWTFSDADIACGWTHSPCSLRLEPRIGLNYAFVWPKR